LGCDVAADLAVVSSVDGLAAVLCAGKILLMLGDICAEALMPKNFPFYNPEHHQRIYSLLEEKRPAAILTATMKRPDQVGALDPFPMIADGDFDIPSAYCSHTAGEALAEKAGSHFRCLIASRRIPSRAANVIARKHPRAEKKIVVTAHIDAYEDTPGATDNASGTAVLLVLAEMLSDYAGDRGIEMAAFNGEDHYSAGGQKDYLARYGGGLSSVVMGINVDGVGYMEGKSAYSFYECSPDLEQIAASSFKEYPGLIRGEPWYSGDHMIFLQAGLPCLAFTSEKAFDLLQSVTHTHLDTPDIVDPVKIVEVASALNDLIRSIGK
jgi:aminopeptidase YwaD